MKKILALMLALCLMIGVAMAEETEVPEITWDSIPEDMAANGEFQQITIPDVLTFAYWIPTAVMQPLDVTQIPENAPAAAFATEDGAYTVAVFVLQVTSLAEYGNGLEASGADLKQVTVNGFTAFSAENETAGVDQCVIPVNDNMVILFTFTPLHGDDTWDAYKAAIVASVQSVE